MEPEVEHSSQNDSDHDSMNSFDIQIDTPKGKKVQTSQHTSIDSKKDEREGVLRSISTFLNYNLRIPAAYLRNFRPVHVEEQRPVHFGNLLKKSSSAASQVIQEIKSHMGKVEVDTLDARCSSQIVVARLVQSVKQTESEYVAEIEDEKSSNRMDIGEQVLWTGMIAVMKLEWRSEMYYLKEKLSRNINDQKPTEVLINNNPPSTTIVVAKGPFCSATSLDFHSLSVMVESLRNNQPDILVLMGPFMNKHHLLGLTDFADETLKKLLKQIESKLPHTKLIIVPSTSDALSRYPIPQPPLTIRECQTVLFASNPSIIKLKADGKDICRMSLINTDIIQAIEKNLKMKPAKNKNLYREICQAYTKQEMAVPVCTDPLDQGNLMNLYNGGQHGDFILYASNQKAPMTQRIGRHLFLGTGSLFIPKEKIGYFTQITIYDGTSNLLDRVRADVRKIAY